MRLKSISAGSHLTMRVPRLDASMYLQEMGKRYILWSGEEGSTNRCLQTEPAIADSQLATIRFGKWSVRIRTRYQSVGNIHLLAPS